jgi:two-component system, OmpR family, sensor histidine kinase KdpD
VSEPHRGQLRVFLGMAAGVGKTYRMLQEAHAEAEAGRDVVIGYLEPHERPETTVLADGLEMVPRRRVTYRETTLEDMDLPAVLRRSPELCLIDELAHTNAPELEHAKRYEDVEDVLAAGIDVFSTVNVQHLESLNDPVAQLTGTRVRETMPDAVLAEADEVVLIDLTPEALLERLRAGNVYPLERVPDALNNFFKVENLNALREVALRQLAEEVEAKRLVAAGPPAAEEADRLIDAAAPQAVGERLLALIKPRPSSQRIVRRAWRSAQRLQGELDLLWVAAHKPTGAESEQLEALRQLATALGAHLLVEEDPDVAEAVRRVADERGTTYILMGAPRARGPLKRLRRPALAYQLLRSLPGVDLRFIADRTERRREA